MSQESHTNQTRGLITAWFRQAQLKLIGKEHDVKLLGWLEAFERSHKLGFRGVPSTTAHATRTVDHVAKVVASAPTPKKLPLIEGAPNPREPDADFPVASEMALAIEEPMAPLSLPQR